MPNRKEHLKAGAVSGGIVSSISYLFDHLKIHSQYQQQGITPPSFDFLEFTATTVGGTCLGAIGGVLPDILEPAIHSYHRKTMHSITAGITLATMVAKNQDKMTRVEKSLANAFTTAYGSHLWLDSKTPRGIPFI